jgi:ribosomal protein S18 acetylase RimI-like enzyme
MTGGHHRGVHVRRFERERDLAPVLAVVAKSRAKDEPGAIFHPGGLQWWLRRLGLPRFDVAVLTDEKATVGVALRDHGDVIVQADVDHSDARADLLAWIESQLEREQSELVLTVADGDDDLRRIAAARGYAPSEGRGFELVYDLAADPGGPSLPAGFDMRSLTQDIADAYVELHRAAWSRPGAPSTYDRRQHDLVTAMPDFRYDLVPVVAGPGGALAAYCISWWDPRSRSVEIEPLGTHAGFRRKGLARAIVREVFRRSWALGARYVLVWGSHDNAEARALYLSAGMRVRRAVSEFVLRR